MKKIKVEQEKCIGCGLCQTLCPEVFEIIEGKSQVKDDADFNKNKDCAEQAAQSCPTEAIN